MTTLRPARDNDQEFLYRVYASTREEEMKLALAGGWSPRQVEPFLRQQFFAQDTHYRKFFPETEFLVIMDDDTPVGRLYIDRRKDEIRIIDIALLTEHRGRGIGGKLMREILEEGRRGNLPVRIHVEKNNPAMHLYHRLGFETIEDAGVYNLMEWQP